MAITKISIIIIAMTMALTITIFTIRATTQVEPNRSVQEKKILEATIGLPSSKSVRRFLASSNANPRATAVKCHKDNEICNALMGDDYKCCNNKCMDLSEDKHNCGECKNHCKYTEECCRGECVDVNYDERHCGQCNNPCPDPYVCFYASCNYA